MTTTKKTTSATPVRKSLDSLINNTAKELNKSIEALNINRNPESLQRVRQLEEMLQQTLELAESYKNITGK